MRFWSLLLHDAKKIARNKTKTFVMQIRCSQKYHSFANLSLQRTNVRKEFAQAVFARYATSDQVWRKQAETDK